ncbi:MAG: branched-chain amino acid ABC transporter permease, partial [Proteobacteria bacterium]|nr:branched-chain amino acid ABC transporter permease [Pseudomonadota bacterium]
MSSLPIGYRFGLVLLALLAGSPWLPPWLLFMLTIAAANGLVVLGCMLFYRAGLVSFGQALYFCTGAYTTGLVTNLLGVTDVLLLLGLSGLAGGLLAYLVGFLLARYRGIFFGLLSMAFSMILYGVLTKTESLGSTDGFNVPAFTLLGFEPDQPQVRFTLLAVAVAVVWLVSLVTDRFLRSPYGPLLVAIHDNEIRTEYMGASAKNAVHLVYVAAGILAGMGGCIGATAVGHIDPTMAYWTTSGEFVFITIMAGV